MKLRAAVGSLLVGAAVAGAAVVPSSSAAHGSSGPLCWGNVNPAALMLNDYAYTWLYYGEAFRIQSTYLVNGTFKSWGHSASSSPVDYEVNTNDLRCDHPPT